MGIKLISEIKESGFKKTSSSEYELFILMRMDSLTYFISDQNARLLLFRYYEIEGNFYSKKDYYPQLEALVKADDLLQLLYRKSKLTLGNQLYSLVPKRLFNAKDAKSLLSQLTTQTITDFGTDYLEELNSVAIYDLDKQMTAPIQSRQANAKIFHTATPFLLGCQKIAQTSKEKSIFANIQKAQIQIAVFEKENLLFFNTFQFQTAKDCLYFIMLVYEQLGLEPSELLLNLAGKIVEDSEIYTLLYRYIIELNFMKPPTAINLGNSFDKIGAHFYFDLFSLYYSN